MLIYILGVTKNNPLDSTSAVQAKIYETKPAVVTDAVSVPVPMRPPMYDAVGNFTFTVPDSQVETWKSNIGKFADMSVLSFK